MKYISILLLTALSLVCLSCRKKTTKIINPIENAAKDSTMLYKDSILKVISIGNKITPQPLGSQIYHNDSSVNYVLLDKNDLCIFDYKTGILKKTLSINSSFEEGCGTLNNYSGFYYHSPDSVFIYNYKLKTVFLIDSTSVVRKKWSVINPKLAKYPVDPEALTPSPITYMSGNILLSGSGHGQPKDATEKNKPVSCIINLINDSIKYVVGYPQQYRDADFGGVYFNSIYHSSGISNASMIYSFPADHYIYQYNATFSEIKKEYAGSRYVEAIESSVTSFVELYVDKEKRIEYFVSQASYHNVLYDKYRQLFYRIAAHPLLGWKSSDLTLKKPFSIIIINQQGEVISETPIFNDYESLNLDNMHVAPEGLLIQKNTEDENVLSFILLKINNMN